MPTSEARSAASRLNGSRSKGPVSPEGRQIAARNSLKHGLSGDGVVLAAEDQAEVERLDAAFSSELAPKSELGAALIHELASLTVRMKRATRHEFAASDERVRNAPENFDRDREDQAEALFETIQENPRANLRKLKRTPEGVIILIDAWNELKADMTRPGKSYWPEQHMIKMGHLMGIREEAVRGSLIGVLSDATWGDFSRLSEHEGGKLDEEDRKQWARERLVAMINQTLRDLSELSQYFDYETIELDRAESGERALFDTSKPAVLARRYESELSRRLHKTLKEFHEAEARAAEVAATQPKPPAATPAPPSSGSFREAKPDFDSTPPGYVPFELQPVDESFGKGVEVARGADGQPLTIARSTPQTS